MRRQSLARLRKLLLQFFKGKRVRVLLYGSCARGDVWSGSDIDIAFEPGEKLNPIQLADLNDKIEELPIPYKVDFVNLRQVSPALRRAILKDAVVWKR